MSFVNAIKYQLLGPNGEFTPLIFNVVVFFLGLLIGFFANRFFETIWPPETEIRRQEVTNRVFTDTGRLLAESDMFMQTYLRSTNNQQTLEFFQNTEVTNLEDHKDSELRKQLIEALSDKQIFSVSNVSVNGKTLINIEAFYVTLKSFNAASDNFMNKYGSVDHNLVTIIRDMSTKARALTMILEYAMKEGRLPEPFHADNIDQFADFASSYYISLKQAQTIISTKN